MHKLPLMEATMFFDTHAHYDDEDFNEDRDSFLTALPQKGIDLVVDPASNMASSRLCVELSEKYPFLYAAVGVHPHDAKEMTDESFDELRSLAAYKKVVAIGEIGLDYHGFDIYDDKPSKEVQQKWFWRQLRLAAEIGKPVVIHSRNACEDTLLMMQKAYEELGIDRAIIHCFSYAKETAAQYLGMGYYLGFGGTTTYEGQKKLTKVLEITPMDRILLETDCPYLAPVPHRGERNDSRNLKVVAEKIAEIKGVTAAEVEAATLENARRIYGI